MTPTRMKDSGIAWVREIPSSWDVKPNKYVMTKKKRICPLHKEEPILSLTMNGVVVRDLDNLTGKRPASFDGYQRIQKGNLLMCLFDIDVTPRCVGLITNDGLTSPAYSQFCMINNDIANYYYYYYLMLDYTKELLHLAKNLRHSLTEDQLGAIKVPVPPVSEQQRIADYLDKKCAEIDTLSSSIQQQIDTLEQYKRAVITETVTKGLTPSAPMKDSGIPWIGKIPAHWSTIKVKFIAHFINGYAFDSETLTTDGENTVIRIGDIAGGSIEPETALKYSGPAMGLLPYQVLKHDILVALSGATVGKTGYIKEDYPNTFINQRVGIIRSVYSRFLNYALQTSSFIPFALLHAAASAQPNISLNTIGNYTIAFPHKKQEQQAIADYLDDKCSKIDAIIQDKQQQLEKLEQYKKATIFEYITGKKQVPEV